MPEPDRFSDLSQSSFLHMSDCEVYRGSVVAAATERRSVCVCVVCVCVCVCVCGAAPVSNTAPIFNTTQPDKLRPVARYRRSCKLFSNQFSVSV